MTVPVTHVPEARLQRSEIPADPRQALFQCLDGGHTGCLVAHAGAVERRVYVMLGEVLAAHGEDEDARMVARLRAADRLTDAAYEDLLARIASAQPVGEVLFDVVAEDALMVHLYERFRQNLAEFLAEGEVAEFHEMDAVFTENIQVGHDSRTLLAELLEENERVADLRGQPTMVLAPGAAPTVTDAEQVILVRCGERTRVGELLGRSPYEPNRTLALVRHMIDTGMLVGLVTRPRTRTIPPTEQAEAPRPSEPRTSGHFAFEVAAPSPVAPPPSQAEAPAGADIDDSFFADEDTAEVARPAVSFDPNEGFDDLAAFQDYDTSREGGSFLTDRTLLDRVDLEDRVAMPASTDTIIEMEDAESAGKDVLKSAVSLNFSGPKLAEDEMERKLDVTNDVLEAITEALDGVGGSRAGQARMQLLIESASVNLAPLFKGVEVAPDGRLPTGIVLKNLRKRPAGEQRRLLNRGLSDLVERALSAADEALDEETLESMLEKIAGYQQRFGI